MFDYNNTSKGRRDCPWKSLDSSVSVLLDMVAFPIRVILSIGNHVGFQEASLQQNSFVIESLDDGS